MESAQLKKAEDRLDVRKVPMITTAPIGASVRCGPAAVEGEAKRLGLTPTQLPNGRKLYSFEQAEAIIHSILKRGLARV
jgi:hypothetical protein